MALGALDGILQTVEELGNKFPYAVTYVALLMSLKQNISYRSCTPSIGHAHFDASLRYVQRLLVYVLRERVVGIGEIVPQLINQMRAIDKGLVNSRVGLVLVTPAMLRRLPAEGIADKELSALLWRERLVPVVHGTNVRRA